MSKKSIQSAPKSFESAVQELEQIVREMEDQEQDLETTLVRYERGQFLMQFCREQLSIAQQRVEQLSQAADGSPKSEPIAE
jgi:exodeoxyribonuclease VII small subunit